VALNTIKTLSLDIYQHLFTLSKDILDIRDIATTHCVSTNPRFLNRLNWCNLHVYPTIIAHCPSLKTSQRYSYGDFLALHVS